MKEMYGVGILIAYFIKWPIFRGLPFLVYKGLEPNYVLGFIWIVCLVLVLKDLVTFIKSKF